MLDPDTGSQTPLMQMPACFSSGMSNFDGTLLVGWLWYAGGRQDTSGYTIDDPVSLRL